MAADQPAPIPPVNDVAESVQHDQGLFQTAQRAPVGIDERGRRRQRRQIHLGRRALRQQQLPRCGDERDQERSDDPEVRHERHAREGLRRRSADLSARDPRRSRRQHLGDRRSGQRAASGARSGAGAAAGARRAGAAGAAGAGAARGPRGAGTCIRRRPRATRSSSSVPTESC